MIRTGLLLQKNITKGVQSQCMQVRTHCLNFIQFYFLFYFILPGGGEGESVLRLSVTERMQISAGAIFHDDAREV